eukprot:SAG31_NODE_1277_length_9041_cov_22.545627_6_plen_47_part_00
MSPGPCNRPGGARGMQHATKSIAPLAVCELAVSMLRKVRIGVQFIS